VLSETVPDSFALFCEKTTAGNTNKTAIKGNTRYNFLMAAEVGFVLNWHVRITISFVDERFL
jgi:hypothetical protein